MIKRRPRAYVIGPFRANSELLRRQNIARAEKAALDLAMLGFYYRCPHLHSAHFDGLLEDEYWLDLGLDLLSECDAAYLVPEEPGSSPLVEGGTGPQRSWLLPRWLSQGSAAEVAWCREHSIPVLCNIIELRRFIAAWRAQHVEEKSSGSED